MDGIDDALGHLTILPSTWWPPRRERPLTTRAEGPATEHTRTNAPERKAPGAGTGRQGLARVVFRDGEAKPALRSHGGRFDPEPRSKTRHGTDDHGGGPEITPRHAGDLRAHRYPRARRVQRLAHSRRQPRAAPAARIPPGAARPVPRHSRDRVRRRRAPGASR